jgi:hypothetical protein
METKYTVFILKIFELFDVPSFKEHEIKNIGLINIIFNKEKPTLDNVCQTYDECGKYDKMGPDALCYHRNVTNHDEEKTKVINSNLSIMKYKII